MSTIQNLTLAIITFKRPKELGFCLNSLVKQKMQPAEVILIDNDPHCSARDIAKHYSAFLPLRYLSQPIKSIPRCRNLALDECKTSYLSFIDDDCVLSPNWSLQAQSLLTSDRQFAFIQGAVKKTVSRSPLIKAQEQRYQEWVSLNQTSSGFCAEGLDTKNLILNLDLLNVHSIRFDLAFPIFEDVDLGKQLLKNHLTGLYCSSLKVSHPYSSHLISLLRKTYYQGKVRYLLDKKWCTHSSISPLADLRWYRHPPSSFFIRIRFFLGMVLQALKINPIEGLFLQALYCRLLDTVFDQGYLDAQYDQFTPPSSVVILNRYNKSANEERAKQIHQFLTQNGLTVSIVDSEQIFISSSSWRKALLISPLIFLLYKSTHLFLRFFHSSLFISLSYFFELILRGKFIGHYFKRNSNSVFICQYSEDIFSALYLPSGRVLLDLPTIYSYELLLSKKYPRLIIRLIEVMEQRSYLRVSAVCFHWYSFRNLALVRQKKFKKLFTLNWGCSPVGTHTKFEERSRLVYLGNVNSEWINPPLLEKLSQSSVTPLDIYSYEIPDPKCYSHLKHKGFLSDLDNLNQYQFGLITITNDDLRNNGFSAKYLTYLSYGLPVFCPEWRRDPVLEPASIYYNENNFNQQLKKYSNKKLWLLKHRQALKLARQLYWNNTLSPLLSEIYSLINAS